MRWTRCHFINLRNMKKEWHFHNYHKSHIHQYYYVSGRGESRVIVWEGLSLVVASFQKVNTKNAHSCNSRIPHPFGFSTKYCCQKSTVPHQYIVYSVIKYPSNLVFNLNLLQLTSKRNWNVSRALPTPLGIRRVDIYASKLNLSLRRRCTMFTMLLCWNYSNLGKKIKT